MLLVLSSCPPRPCQCTCRPRQISSTLQTTGELTVTSPFILQRAHIRASTGHVCQAFCSTCWKSTAYVGSYRTRCGSVLVLSWSDTAFCLTRDTRSPTRLPLGSSVVAVHSSLVQRPRTCAAAYLQAQLYPVKGSAPGAFRILIQRPDSTGVFSGDFTNKTSDSGADNLASVKRSFAGEYVPLEVYDVDTSTGNGTSDLSPAQLCAYLKEQNPGILISICCCGILSNLASLRSRQQLCQKLPA